MSCKVARVLVLYIKKDKTKRNVNDVSRPIFVVFLLSVFPFTGQLIRLEVFKFEGMTGKN